MCYQSIDFKFIISSVVTLLSLNYQQYFALRYNFKEIIHSFTACVEAGKIEKVCMILWWTCDGQSVIVVFLTPRHSQFCSNMFRFRKKAECLSSCRGMRYCEYTKQFLLGIQCNKICKQVGFYFDRIWKWRIWKYAC